MFEIGGTAIASARRVTTRSKLQRHAVRVRYGGDIDAGSARPFGHQRPLRSRRRCSHRGVHNRTVCHCAVRFRH